MSEPQQRLDLGVVLGAALAVVRREWGLLLLVALAGLWAPTALIRVASISLYPLPLASAGAGGKLLAEGVIGVGLSGAASAAMARIALDRLAGGPGTLGRSLVAALRYGLAAAGVLLISSWPTLAAYGLQMALGGRPAWFGLVGWAQLASILICGVFLGAAIPLMIDREVSAPRAIIQAVGLTRGSRWRTLALSALGVVVTYGGLIASAYAVYLGPAAVRRFPAAQQVASGLVISLLDTVTIALQAAVYRELWRLRTGVAPGADLAMFD